MIRYLTESDIQKLLTMPLALQAMEEAHQALAEHRAIDIPRARIHLPQGGQHVLQAAAPELGYIGFKYYYTRPSGRSFYVHLMSIENGTLDAIIEAVCQVRKIKTVKVFARNKDRLVAFCNKMTEKTGVEVRPAESAEAAVRGSHIVNVITKASEPVLKGEWLEPGQHVNAAGSNALTRREIDLAAVKKCDVVTVDGRGTARNECGDLLPAVEKGWLRWDHLTEIGEVIAKKAPGRASAQQITLYESHGMGLQDLWIGVKALALSRERGIGTDLPVGNVAAR